MSSSDEPSAEAPLSSLAWGEMAELPSLCMKCHDPSGRTRLLGLTIPHFRELIVSSFECPTCGEQNREVQFGGSYGERVVTYELHVVAPEDLNRQVVKSQYATLRVPEIDLEIPPESQSATLNTIEGVLERVIEGLQQQQPLRHQHYPESAAKIDAFIERIRACLRLETHFTVILSDISGNSYIQSTHTVPSQDTRLTISYRDRTDIDNQRLGIAIDYNSARTADEESAVDAGAFSDIVSIPTPCHACAREGSMNVHRCDIPHFKEVVIMSFRCDHCGYKSSEVKPSAAVPPFGKRLTLHVREPADLKRDVLKSDTASLSIPELDLELAEGTLGSFFSTVEGVLVQIRDQLKSLPQAAFVSGDSAVQATEGGSMDAFLARLDTLIEGTTPFTLIMDDPLGNIYIQNARAHLPPPNDIDGQLIVEEYTRTAEQDEELGLHDVKTD